jgi:cation diffusion facilitator family transporter
MAEITFTPLTHDQDISQRASSAVKKANRIERKALRYTLWANAAITLLSVFFALCTRSEAIFLDGLFSGVQLVISLLSLRIAQLIQRPEDDEYPFGYAMFEPLLNMGKGLIILVVALLALFSSLESLLGGGRSVEAGLALGYALMAALGCLAMALVQRHYANQSHSQILALDFKNWLIDGAISTGVAVAFGLMLALQDTAWQWFIPYADPVLVILLVVVMLPLPLQTVVQNGLQMMGRAPSEDQREQVDQIVAEALASVPYEEYHLRQSNTGRLVYVQVYLCVSLQQEGSYEAGEIDSLRSHLYSQLHEVFPHLAMDLIVTCDRIWVKRAVMPAQV